MSILTNQLGLSLTEDKIQLVEIVNKDNTIYLENVDEEYFEESLNVNTKEAKFIHILQNAFNEIVLRKPVSSSKISVALPPNYFKIFELPIDKNLTKNDVNDYIKWEISKLFPTENSSSFSFEKLVLTTPKYELYKKFLVFAINKNILKRIHKFCVRNNLKLLFVDNAHITSTALITDEAKSQNLLSILIENNYFSSLLLSKNNLIFEKNGKYNSVPDVSEIIKEVIDKIYSSEIVKTIDKIFVFGNDVTKELCNDISSSTELIVERVKPFNTIRVAPEIENSKYILDLSEKFAASASISFRIGL